ncbi:putative transcription factor C2H2 family [Helianthus anomalus]
MNKLDNQSISKNFSKVFIIWNEQAGHPVDLYTISTRYCSSPRFFILRNVCLFVYYWITRCGHNFCLKCFEKWVGQGKITCAICRTSIPSKATGRYWPAYKAIGCPAERRLKDGDYKLLGVCTVRFVFSINRKRN